MLYPLINRDFNPLIFKSQACACWVDLRLSYGGAPLVCGPQQHQILSVYLTCVASGLEHHCSLPSDFLMNQEQLLIFPHLFGFGLCGDGSKNILDRRICHHCGAFSGCKSTYNTFNLNFQIKFSKKKKNHTSHLFSTIFAWVGGHMLSHTEAWWQLCGVLPLHVYLGSRNEIQLVIPNLQAPLPAKPSL